MNPNFEFQGQKGLINDAWLAHILTMKDNLFVFQNHAFKQCVIHPKNAIIHFKVKAKQTKLSKKMKDFKENKQINSHLRRIIVGLRTERYELSKLGRALVEAGKQVQKNVKII